MNDRLDQALEAGLLVPPRDFTERVMARLPARRPDEAAPRRDRLRDVVEWLALTGVVLAGMTRLIPLLFGLWTSSSAL